DLALPEYIFDAASWRALGKHALRGATIHTDELAFDPGILARLGIAAPYRGRISAHAEIAAAAASTTITAELHELRGGPLAKPIDATARASLDARGLEASASATAGTRVLAELTAHSPIGLDTISPQAPVTGT